MRSTASARAAIIVGALLATTTVCFVVWGRRPGYRYVVPQTGRQIVSEQWARESLKQQAPDRGDGYRWWTHPFQVGGRAVTAAWAGGYGGQFIYLFPDLHLVAVSTGWNPDNGGQFIAAMERYILPAARVD